MSTKASKREDVPLAYQTNHNDISFGCHHDLGMLYSSGHLSTENSNYNDGVVFSIHNSHKCYELYID